ncbi:hypothetical protein ACEWPL_011920 [Roseovarius sp. S1116L3]|uniref:hypothetical protein n=1 Tax=Roseovarius roseus TaxID=3342636 RepID=UPI0037299631
MEITKNTLDDIRKDLEKSVTGDRKMTSKKIEVALAPDIHKQMSAGVKLMTIYEIVRAKLPKEARLTESTFKKYWRNARDELRLEPIKASGRKGPREAAADDPQKTLEAVIRNTSAIKSSASTIAADDLFPDDPDDPQINTSSN